MSEDTPAAVPAPAADRVRLGAGLVLVVTFAAIEALAVATILPRVRDDLGGGELYGWAFSAFLLASIIGLTWAGEAADRHGPALPFMVGLSVFGLGLLLGGLAPSMIVLVAGRALQGLGAGAIPTVAYVVIGRAFSESQRPRMFAYLSSAWVVPGLLGPAAAAGVAEVTSWRVVFLGLLVPLALVVPLVLPALLRIGPPPAPPVARSRVLTACMVAAAAAIGLTGISLIADGRPIGVAPAALGALASGLALRGILPKGTVHLRPGLPALVVSNTFLNLSFFGAEAFLPLALADLRGQPPLVAGLALTVATVTWTSGTWAVERRRRLQDTMRTVPAGLAIIATGIGVAGAGLVDPAPVALVPVGWAIAGLGIGLAYPNLSLALLRVAPAAQQGAATASMKVGEFLGPAVGAGVAGAFIAYGTDRGWEGTAIAGVFTGAVAAGGLAALAARRSGIGPPAPHDALADDRY